MKLPFVYLLSAFVISSCNSGDDPLPSAENTRLTSVTTNLWNSNEGGFSPGSKKIYTYTASGVLEREEYFYYDVTVDEYVLSTTSTFTYSGGKLSSIRKVDSDDQVVITDYGYFKDKLTEIEIHDGIDTHAQIAYQGDTIQVFYSHSNGRSFTYRFSTTGDNIGFEKTINDSHVTSSKITNEFDNGINPYSLLGYIDPLFTNFSRNNKTKTISQYFTPLPQSVPSLYEYEYNDQKLPVRQVTTYLSYPSGAFSGKAECIFEYEN